MAFRDDPEADQGEQLAQLRATRAQVEQDLASLSRWRWLRRRLTQSTLADIRQFEGTLAQRVEIAAQDNVKRRDRDG